MPLDRKLSGCQVFWPDKMPVGWLCEPLGNRMVLNYGRALKDEARKPGDTDVYGSNGIVGTHREVWLKPPGIVVGRKGTVGSIHFAQRDYWPIDTAYYVVPEAGDDIGYLFYLLDYLPLKSLNAATGVPGLSRRDAYALRGTFPEKHEQSAIASMLDVVDSAIRRARQAVDSAKQLQRSLLADAFARMEAQPRKLREFTTDVRYGTSKASSSRQWGNPVLRIPNVVGDQLTLADLAFVELSPTDVGRLALTDGDLLLVRTNGNPNYVGRSAVFRAPDERTWIYASYLIRVRLNAELLADYVNVYLGIERGRRELLRRVTTSAGNHNINSNSIRLLTIPVPRNIEVQKEVIDIAWRCRTTIGALGQKVEALMALKKSLLHDLLTGTVRLDPALFAETSA